MHKHQHDWNKIRSQHVRFLSGADRGRKNRSYWDKQDDSADWFRETHNRRLKHKPILKGEKEKAIVGFLAAWFRSSRLTYFQYEGEARIALRLMLIESGHSWQKSDDEAHRLIESALREIGAQRPPKEEGQPEWTAEEWCAFCLGPLDDESISRRDRYCCSECARLALTKRSWGKGGYSTDYFGRIAYRQVRRQKMPERQCKNCGTMFQPNTHTMTDNENRQYCSTQCWYEARRYLPDIECQNPRCRNVFRPDGAGRKYCSHQCSVEGRSLILPLRNCGFCGALFQPANESALYCSPEHNRKMKDRRKKEARQAAKAERVKAAKMTDPASPIGKLFDAA